MNHNSYYGIMKVKTNMEVIQMNVVIGGTRYSITKKQIEKAMKGVPAEHDGIRRKYFIKVHGVEYPIKYVIEKTLKIPAMEFTTRDAWSILKRLDYKLITR